MILTQSSQEALLHKYSANHKSIDECYAFVEGMQATIKLIDKMMRDQNKHNNKLKKIRNASQSTKPIK